MIICIDDMLINTNIKDIYYFSIKYKTWYYAYTYTSGLSLPKNAEEDWRSNNNIIVFAPYDYYSHLWNYWTRINESSVPEEIKSLMLFI